jgi:hypothetical protein
MFNYLKNLIARKFYNTKEEAQIKCDVFFGVNRLTEEQYIELSELVNTVYVEEEVTA